MAEEAAVVDVVAVVADIEAADRNGTSVPIPYPAYNLQPILACG